MMQLCRLNHALNQIEYENRYVMLRRRNLQKYLDEKLGKEEYDFKKEITEQLGMKNLPGAAVAV